MREFFWKYDFDIKVILLVWLLVLSGYLMLFTRQISTPTGQARLFGFSRGAPDTCGEECKKLIDEKIAGAVATLSAQRQVVKAPETPNSKQTAFISLVGNLTTKEIDWKDVKGSDVNIKIEDYGQDPYVDWNASIKTTAGGQAFARLFDVTHGIAVSDSQVSATTFELSQSSSGRIYLWSGNNLYRVQIKSLSGTEVSFNSGRVKIVY